MAFGHSDTRMNVEGDRLSNLPDDLIHKILSFIGMKQAVKTSALSSRWRYIWTSMPFLDFSNKDFHTMAKFSEFVTHVLSGRNNQIEVSSVNVTLSGKVSKAFVNGILNIILNYAFSHNVQQLNMDIIGYEPAKETGSPLSLFSSQSLKHLTLRGFFSKDSITTPFTWKLLALATLNLHCVTLYDDNNDRSAGLFSNCANLKNLTIYSCIITGPNGFNIRHSGLSNLTLEYGHGRVNVVTPQLKNLTIISWSQNLIFAPDLASLHYEGYEFSLRLSSALLHLEKANVCVYSPSNNKANARELICMLQQLSSVKFLTLNLELIKDIRAMNNTKLAQNLITKLRKLLEQVKASTESKLTKMHEQEKAHIDIDSCWKYLSLQIEKEKENASVIISHVKEIKGLLTKLPASNRAIIQPSFSTLCAEADIVMNKITDCTKMQCDENQRRLSVFFHEQATSLEPSS